MRNRIASWSSLLLLVGCSAEAPPARQPEPPPPAVATSSAAAAPTTPSKREVPLPPAVAAAVNPVCVYEANAGDVSAVDLYVPGSETRWATVLEGTFKTELPRTDAGHPVLSVDTPGVRVRAEGRLATLPFQLARPKVFAGIAVPNSDHVAVAAVTATGLTLIVQKATHFTSTLLQDAASCGDVVIGRTDWSATSVLPDTSAAKRALLATGVAIPVRATEGGPPVGELSFPKKQLDELGGWQSVSVVAVSKSSSRIVFRQDWGTVFGWVPTSAIKPVPPPTKRSRGAALREAAEFGMIGLLSGAGDPPAGSPLVRARVTCRHEVPLIVELGGREVTVGAILAGVEMEVGATRGETTRLSSPPTGLNPMPEARLFVSSPALEDCSRTNAMSPRGVPHDE